MSDNDLENIYKSAISESHYAGLRAVFDAGWEGALGVVASASTPDLSLSAAAPSGYVSIATA